MEEGGAHRAAAERYVAPMNRAAPLERGLA